MSGHHEHRADERCGAPVGGGGCPLWLGHYGEHRASTMMEDTLWRALDGALSDREVYKNGADAAIQLSAKNGKARDAAIEQARLWKAAAENALAVVEDLQRQLAKLGGAPQ